MTIKKYFLIACFISSLYANSQRVVYKHPIELYKVLGFSNTDEHNFLKDNQTGNLVFFFKDYKNVECALIDSNFNIKEKLHGSTSDLPLRPMDDAYKGGIVNGTKALIFFEKERKGGISYVQLTSDFNSKTFTSQELLTLPETEKPLITFSHHNRFFILTADDKKSELVIYQFDKEEKFVKKNIPFTVPPTKNKRRNEISEYLQSLSIFKNDEQAGLEAAVSRVKLFSMPDKLILMSNKDEALTSVLEISLPSLAFQEKIINYSALVDKTDKPISSFYKDGKLYALALNKKNIRVGIYDVSNGVLLKTHEINESNFFKTIPGGAVHQSWEGNYKKESTIKDFEKLLKTLSSNTDGLVLSTNKKGQIIILGGTYDEILTNAGSALVTQQNANNGPLGHPTSLRYYGTYYKSTFFTILLDPATLDIGKGSIPLSVNDQMENYIKALPKSKKTKTKYFSVGENEYYSYYDKDQEAYIIEQVKIIR
jgi:hypothetical protein